MYLKIYNRIHVAVNLYMHWKLYFHLHLKTSSYSSTCTFKHVLVGNMYLSTSCWKLALENLYLSTCSWKHVLEYMYFKICTYFSTCTYFKISACTWNLYSSTCTYSVLFFDKISVVQIIFLKSIKQSYLKYKFKP